MRGGATLAVAAAAAAAMAAGPARAQTMHTVSTLGNFSAARECNFKGEIKFAGPSSIDSTDSKYELSRQQREAAELVIELVNKRCGVDVGGDKYRISISSIDDESNPAYAGEVAASLDEDDTYFGLWGPYSSGITGPFSEALAQSNKLVLFPGASKTALITDDFMFGGLPTNEKYFAPAIEALGSAGARTFAVLKEDSAVMCDVDYALAEKDLELVHVGSIPEGASLDAINAQLATIRGAEPDVLLACVTGAACTEVVRAMRNLNYAPNALVMSVCPGQDSFRTELGGDAEYILGVAPWVDTLKGRDSFLNLTVAEYIDLTVARINTKPSYQGAASAGLMSAILSTIQETNSVDRDVVAAYLANNTFETVFGTLKFNAARQPDDLFVMVQYNRDGDIPLVHPAKRATAELVYPLPTWLQRDCLQAGGCSNNGECQSDGTCICNEGYKAQDTFCIGNGELETQISDSVKVVSYIFFAINMVVALLAMVWTWVNRRTNVVLASQPVFLGMIALGAIVSSTSIIFFTWADEGDVSGLAYKGEYQPANFACRAMLVTYTSGFVLTFAPLFAKLWRVYKVMEVSKTLRRVKISVARIMGIVFGLLLVDLAIVGIWTFLDPLTFYRENIAYDEFGKPTKSAGACDSENEMPYVLAVFIFHVSVLAYGVWLCYKTRNISTVLSESHYVSVAMISNLQVLAVAAPVLLLVSNEPVASMFLRSAVVFLNDFGVLLLIFVPKVWRLHKFNDLSSDKEESTNSHTLPPFRTDFSMTEFTRSRPSMTNFSQYNSQKTSNTDNDDEFV